MGQSPAEASQAEPAQVLFGATRLELSSGFVRLLDLASVSVVSSRPGNYESSTLGPYLAFPIPAGQVSSDAAVFSLSHRGGVDLRVADRVVELRDLVIERRGPSAVVAARIAAQAASDGRLPLFDVVLEDSLGAEPGAAMTSPSRLTVAAAPLRLSSEAAGRLNEALGVDVFRGNMPVGTVYISAYVANVISTADSAG